MSKTDNSAVMTIPRVLNKLPEVIALLIQEYVQGMLLVDCFDMDHLEMYTCDDNAWDVCCTRRPDSVLFPRNFYFSMNCILERFSNCFGAYIDENPRHVHGVESYMHWMTHDQRTDSKVARQVFSWVLGEFFARTQEHECVVEGGIQIPTMWEYYKDHDWNWAYIDFFEYESHCPCPLYIINLIENVFQKIFLSFMEE